MPVADRTNDIPEARMTTPSPQEARPLFTFVDLFAGIGGFHAALKAYGGECMYAVEIDPAAAKVYELNWGHDPLGDVTQDANDDTMNVPAHDVLAAGLPCQPFSKSGAQRGMDETRGTLYWNTLKIIQAHHPRVVILENVRNIAGPRHLHEWQIIIETLRDEGYHVSDAPAVFSPHLLPLERGGRPQVRERVFVTATYDPDGLGGFPPQPAVTNVDLRGGEEWDLDTDLPLQDDHHVTGCDLSTDERHWINAWDEWVQTMHQLRAGQPNRRLPGFPIWVDAWVHEDKLKIPADTPAWKANFLRKNSALYTAHQDVFDAWVKKWKVKTATFPPSRRKLEWQAQDTPRLWDCVLHFRPSGIRAKRPTYLPALVAITQTSVVGLRERRLSPREAARLQGLPDEFQFGTQSPAATYRQMGNGVNVGVVWHVLREHVRRDEAILKLTAPNVVAAVLNDTLVSPDDVLPGLLARSLPASS